MLAPVWRPAVKACPRGPVGLTTGGSGDFDPPTECGRKNTFRVENRLSRATSLFRRSTMNFGFTEEQDLLRAEVRKFLDEEVPLERVREMTEGDSGLDGDLWRRMAELGWVGMCIPEEYGGAGLDLET
ncbi:MAG TPA: acyl-CoA dehydrogenase family protein, partial [Deltaproteobacteria bacterium]|nr:acyl-CoA dehydrogenase family protein [Deltaproteobacteria bacterium]